MRGGAVVKGSHDGPAFLIFELLFVQLEFLHKKSFLLLYSCAPISMVNKNQYAKRKYLENASPYHYPVNHRIALRVLAGKGDACGGESRAEPTKA